MHERFQVNDKENQVDNSDVRQAEALSALMDGEASELELRRLLLALDGENRDGLLAHWSRFHQIQSTLHNAVGPQTRVDLLPGIRARLESEGQFSPQRSGFGLRTRGIATRIAQGAVAASVAAAVLFGATQVDQRLRGTPFTEGDAALVAGSTEAARMPELGGEYNPSALTRTVSMGAAERDRIQRAVQQFSGQAPAVRFNEVYTFPVQTQPLDPENNSRQ